MANPQLEDGKTEIANDTAEALAKTHFSPAESKVLWAILRKTYGWHKKADRISYSQFEELTGMNRWHIGPAIKRLVSRHIITVSGTGYLLEYGLQKDFDKWKIVTENGNESLPKTVTKDKDESLPILEKSLPKTVTKSLPISVNTKAINTITKTNNILPEWLDRKTWDAFLEMRNVKKAKPTNYAIELIIKDLAKWRADGEDPQAILEESIKRGWTGVFSLKNKIGGTQNATKSAPDPRKW
jgi:phage replication O-like protein O